MDARIDLDLLDRYLACTCTARERANVERWLAVDPARSVAALKAHAARGYPVHLGDPDAAWARILRRIRAHTPPFWTAKRAVLTGGSVAGRPAWYTLAGLVMGVAAVLIGWHLGSPRFTRNRSVAPLVYETGNGERANITLPDSTKVALGVASHLDVPADFASGNHTVRLNGEALFTVPHHDGTPFTVVAAGATARVLGTTFLVRHYTTDTATVVAVREGRVAVRSMVLTAAREMVIGKSGQALLRPADPAQFRFAVGVLALNSVSFMDAVAQLNRWYDADIRAGDTALLSRHVTGEYASGSLAELSEILEWTFNARVVRNGRVLTLYPR